MKILKVAFFGHRDIDNPFVVEDLLVEYIRYLMYNNEFIEFTVGINGEFDRCAARAVRRAKNLYRDDNSRLILVLPYMTAGYSRHPEDYDNYYDSVEICQTSAKAHPKSAITIRNKEMVDNADVVICYINKLSGGAYNTIEYAKSKEKFIINITKINI